MKMKNWIALALVLAMVLLTGCGAKSNATQSAMSMNSRAMAEEVGVTYDSAAPAAGNAVMNANTMTQLPENRKWIINMNLEAETDDLDAALDAVAEQIKAMDGYVENQSVTNNSNYRSYRSADLTVRIPADQVDSFVQEIGSITNVIYNSRSVEDITLTYTDTAGRVTALETEQQRLLELMEQAETMSDLLEIEGRLTEVRTQLESYASRLKLYDNQVDYATVYLYIRQVQEYTPTEEPGFWDRITEGLSGTVRDMGEAAVNTVVWVIVNLPYLVIVGLAGWVLVVIIRRRCRRKAAKKAEQE